MTGTAASATGAGAADAVLALDFRLSLPGFDLAPRLTAHGRRLALFGASGSGKTLMLESIAGLRRPQSGLVHALGVRFFDARARIDLPPQARRVGYVPQDNHLFPHMSVAANVTYGLRDRLPGRVDELLELVGLGDAGKKRPPELSGGQRQRVALARALASEPRLLLLDEPFAALDQPVRRQLRTALAAMLERLGVPSVLVTHDLVEATLLADVIVVMRAGRVVQVGAGDDLLYRPADAYVADLVGMVNRLEVTVLSSGPTLSHVGWGGETLVVARDLGAPGTAVTLGIRPEALGRADPVAGAVASQGYGRFVEVSVERVDSEGAESVLRGRTRAGHMVEARAFGSALAARTGAAWPPVGQNVRLRFDSRDLWPLAPATGLADEVSAAGAPRPPR